MLLFFHQITLLLTFLVKKHTQKRFVIIGIMFLKDRKLFPARKGGELLHDFKLNRQLTSIDKRAGACYTEKAVSRRNQKRNRRELHYEKNRCTCSCFDGNFRLCIL